MNEENYFGNKKKQSKDDNDHLSKKALRNIKKKIKKNQQEE
jgi:hypothetical protein